MHLPEVIFWVTIILAILAGFGIGWIIRGISERF